jgi:BASS family bile acid:Na+ symporter
METMSLKFDESQLFLVNILIAFIMFGVALDLKWTDFKNVFFDMKASFIGLFCQFFFLPATAYMISVLLKLDGGLALGLILVASCPGGNLSNYLTAFCGADKALSIVMSSLSTLLSVIMTPVNLAFWGGMYAPSAHLLKQIEVSPTEVAGTVFFILILPTIVAVFFSKRFPDISAKLNKVFSFLSMGIFFLFIGVSFFKNLDIFTSKFTTIFPPVFLANSIGLLIGYYFSRLWKLSQSQSIAVMFETGIQNAAFGLILIFNYFGGMFEMAIIAGFYGVWHICSGAPLSYIIRNNQHKIFKQG